MMALSKSLQKGQVPMSCQMCEESNEIKWKCLLCNFLLCTKCQKLHKKVKSTNQHTIIDIADIASHQQQTKDKLDFSNIPCGILIHAGQNCCLFCQSCEVVVCPLCITDIPDKHDKHKMIELAKGYELTIKTVETFNSEIDQKIVQNMKVLCELGNFKSSEDIKYDLEEQNILSRGKDLKDEVEKHTNKLLKELNQRKEVLMKNVNDAENRSEKIDKDLDFRKKNLSYALNSNNANQVFSIHSEEKTSRNQSIEYVQTTFKKLPKFVPGKQLVEDFYLGSLVENNDDQKQFELKVINHYKTVFPLVENLVCCGDASTWISHSINQKLQQVKLTNKSLHEMHTFKIDIYNMALLPSGDILLSTRESNLKILFYRTMKVELTHGPGQVIMMDMDGKKEKVYHTDTKGKPIFTLPYRITTDNDSKIYVIDILNDEGSGRIVALDKTNEVRWIYIGNPDLNKRQTLKPKDLVATKSDNIIITNRHKHMIHILNTSGQCIHYLNTKDQLGIHFPNSVDIDNRGTLYIGCNTYQGQPDEAKIYTVQVSGF
ncbi:unnamed protein product [Mytilus coruscus]|uniref:B box-type domain-containing protein n=1 Tax=Mytilus coruscus TaxID=42192 RepID=A0A6J8AI88_MYTCO|nr:unnamed protein product [Mytilus coruscus]